MQWNAQGITNVSSAKQLEMYLNHNQIDVAMLSETYLTDKHKFYLAGYKTHRHDRMDGSRGGVAIAIKNSIQHSLLPPYKTKRLENVSVSIQINRRNVIFTSAYSPKYHSSFESDVKKLTPFNKEFVVFGDFNARSTAWNCSTNNTAGNVLYNLQMRSHFVINNSNTPTHFPHSGMTPSTIDIMLTNSSLFVSQLISDHDHLNSDHSTVTCTIDADTVDRSPNKSPDYRRADWAAYEDYINNNIDLNADFNSSNVTESNIDLCIAKFTSLILEAKEVAVPYSVKSNKSFDVSDRTKSNIQDRNTIKRRWRRCRDPVKKRQIKFLLNQANKIVDRDVFADRNENFTQMLSKLKTGDKKFWRVTKAISGKHSKQVGLLRDGNSVLFTDEEKVNAIANSFEKAHSLTANCKHSIDGKVNKFNKDLSESGEQNVDATTYTTPAEIKTIIKKLKSFKAPGLDKIQNILLKKLPHKAIVLLTKVFNGCLKICYFPEKFKIAKVVPIPKPGKDHKIPSNYRPISLLSCIGKLLEKIIYIRLNKFAIENDIIAKEQFGFRSQHSTTHQIKRVTRIVQSNKRKRKSTGLILLDIEKAFDSVWHNGLVYKLHLYGVPRYLLKLIKSFVSDRLFSVAINGCLSSPRKIPAGVPQGSLISPLLYSLFISDFKRLKNCEVSLYADDTGIMTSAKHTKTIVKKLHHSLKSTNRFLKKWKIQLNATKTQAIIFPYNNSPKRKPTTPLLYDGEEIKFAKSVTFLGVDLDQKRTFGQHIKKVAEKASKCVKSIYPLLARRSKLSNRNKNVLYKSMIRPMMTYGCPVWHEASACHIKKLQIVQNKCLKLIHNLPWRYPTESLHKVTNYSTVRAFIRNLTDKFNGSCAASDFDLIRDLVVD